VIEAEGEHHTPRHLVLFLVASHSPVAVWPQVLVQIAPVQVDEVIALLDDFFRHGERGAFCLSPGCGTRIKAIHALVVDRVDVWRQALERCDVHERHEDQGPRKCRGINSGARGRSHQFFDSQNGRVFGAVRTGNHREHRSWPRAVNHGHRYVIRGIDAGRNVDDPRRVLTARGFRRPDCERRVDICLTDR
jgi:hypothetical protein